MDYNFKRKMMDLLDDDEYLNKLKMKLFAKSRTPKVVSKDTIQDLFQTHYKEHVDFSIPWEEVNSELIAEMIEKVDLLTKDDGFQASEVEIRNCIRDGYNNRRKTFRGKATKTKRKETRAKNRRSYLTYCKRNDAMKHAIEEGVLDPKDKQSCEDFRMIISPYKGKVVEVSSSDEEHKKVKKQQRKQILEKARESKRKNEEMKRNFLLSKQKEFERYVGQQENDQESNELYSSDESDVIPPSQDVKRNLTF